MRQLIILLAFPAMAGCNQAQPPSLECAVTERVSNSSEGEGLAAVSFFLEANLEASDLTDGVWRFSGQIKADDEEGTEEPIEGLYYEYPNGGFDLIASTKRARITIMPSNDILQERGLQGVIMKNGETVSSGRPISASCHVLEPEGE